MKHLTLFVLITFAPLSWGEDVWYCVEELSAKIEPDENTGAYKLQQYYPEKFTLKYEAGSNRLVIKGKVFAGSKPFPLECDYCNPNTPLFNASNGILIFSMQNERFFLGGSTFLEARMTSGTCTKF